MRTRSLIKNCEDSIKAIECKYMSTFGERIMVFTQEEYHTKLTKELTYTKILNMLFSFFCVIALVCLIIVVKIC